MWYNFGAMNPFYKNLALWMVIGLIVILLFNLFQANQSPRGEIVFSDFLKKVESGEVREVTLKGTVRSWIEREEAERIAWSAPGVTKVEDRIVVSP